MMPRSGHKKVLNAASTRSGLAIHRINTARRGKSPPNNANRQPIAHPPVSSLQFLPPAPLGGPCATLGHLGVSGHHPQRVNLGPPWAPAPGLRGTPSLDPRCLWEYMAATTVCG